MDKYLSQIDMTTLQCMDRYMVTRLNPHLNLIKLKIKK